MIRKLCFVALACALAACGSSTQAPQAPPSQEVEELAPSNFPEVEPLLLQAPSSDFVAIEPTEIGIVGGGDIRDTLAPLISVEALSDGESVEMSVRENGDEAVADIVRIGMADDAVQAGHVRVEFHRAPEGWFPVNAYRRHQCRRGANAGAWTTELCA